MHAIYDELAGGHSLIESVRRATARLRGAYALGVIDAQDPEHLVAARQGSPLVIGIGFGEHFIASDVFARLKLMQGYSVLHPMGFDAFGLPAENYAITNQVHPRQAVVENIATYKAQLKKLGFSHISARPQHPVQDTAAIAAFKKTFPHKSQKWWASLPQRPR